MSENVFAIASNSPYLIIKGVTESGTRFRPSDWAQRLACVAGSRHQDGRFRLHPKVRVAVIDGTSALLIDESLSQSEPHLYGFICKFGRENGLLILKRPNFL
jgi:hypothetical protein